MPFKVLIFISALCLSAPSFAAKEGEPAPELTAQTTEGNRFSLKSLKGQVVIVHFWASWCEACRTEMPLLNDFLKEHRSEGLQILAIDADGVKDEAAARAAMQRFKIPWAFAKNAEFKKFGRIWRLPLTFVIDRKGVLRKDGWTLDHALTRADLDATILPLLKP